VSYTHDWPYDPEAGNVPGPEVLYWSVLGSLALILGLGSVLFLYGRSEGMVGWRETKAADVATRRRVESEMPTPTQRATYKFFAVAMLLFLIQVLAGVLTIHDFVGFTTFFGYDLRAILPLPITRSWHIQLSILWISACWIGASIFVLPRMAGVEPRGQLALVNTLFYMLAAVVAGTVSGVWLGPRNLLGDWWRWIGNQGWEFVELGRVWQFLLFIALLLWVIIVYRGVRPALRPTTPWSLPHWLLYTVAAVSLLFCSSFVAGPGTNFVIADFWRWMVIHMWAECFFEVFTTVIVAYFMVAMGLVSRHAAQRVVFFAVLLFLGSGLLGIAHNFYWNAKPMGTLAIGSVFSTLQVIPLVLLTFEAWRFRRLPLEALQRGSERPILRNFGLAEAFLFLIAVNFWNFLGAGVFGFIINLPIVNYYEHGTYLTVNHGHAALMGVYGNLSIAAVLFCGRYLVDPKRWNPRPLRLSFWSLNLGLAVMLLFDTLPAGLLQLMVTLERGLWAARSAEFVEGPAFQTLTWMRAVGGALFVLGGLVPLVWFVQTRWRSLRPACVPAEPAGAVAVAAAVRLTAPQD
jgi:nitric oxide reductase subunit B